MIESSLLGNILEQQEAILREMIDLEEQTREVLIERDASALQQLNDNKEKLAARMSELEQQRSRMVPQGVVLKDFLHDEKPPNAAILESLRISILSLYDDLKSRQKITRRLLLFNQQLVEQALKMLAPGDGAELYSASGEKKQKTGLRFGIINSNA